MSKVKYATQEYYDLWAQTMSNDELVNNAKMTEKWAYVFLDKPTETGPMTWIATWDQGIVYVKEGNSSESVDFKFKSDYKTWSQIIQGMLNPEKATVSGRFFVEGSFTRMMLNFGPLKYMARLAKNIKDVEY